MSFDHLGLTPELLGAIADQGYTTPTPVQAEAIPLVLAGRDVLAGAQTGTGKTAAFVLPILQHLNGTRANSGAHPNGAPRPNGGARPNGGPRPGQRTPVRVLVLTPTRELALQVEQSVRTYGARRPIRSTPIYGGVGFDGQVRALRAGPEIVVATPGRLLDHLGQRTLELSSVEILVLDEADRMLDMGFIRDIRRIMALLPTKRQTLLFSATFSDEIRRLADDLLDRPAAVQVAPRNMAAELVRQVAIRVDRERKRELLTELVRSGRVDQALVFTRTKHGANRLALQLARDGIAASAIHGNRSQSQRVRALEDFKRGRVSILVATEVAARGLDIDSLPHVVNFELPMVAEDYVHRIGRTGRAGAEGDAISLVCVDELKLLAEIERVLGHRIPTEDMPGFEPDRSIRPEPILRRPAMHARPPVQRRGGQRPGGPMSGPGVAGPRRAAPPQPVGRPNHGAGAGNRPAAGQSIGARPGPSGGGQGKWRGGQRPGGPRTPRPEGQRSAGSGASGHGRGGAHPGRPSAMPGERLARHGS